MTNYRAPYNCIGYIEYKANNIWQASMLTCLLSSIFASYNGGKYITHNNIKKTLVLFAIRQSIKYTWENDRDQLSIPY